MKSKSRRVAEEEGKMKSKSRQVERGYDKIMSTSRQVERSEMRYSIEKKEPE